MDSRRRSILGSIKNKFGSHKDSSLSRQSSLKSVLSAQSPTSDVPFSSPAPATRRPGMSAHEFHPRQHQLTNPPARASQSTSTNETPPPAYTAAPQAGPTASATQPPADDPHAFLSSFDTVFLIDDSGSMAGRSWRETGLALQTITPICTAHDTDGIDIYFLNRADDPFHHNVKLPSTVAEIFQTVQPMGGTPTGQRLNQILKPYLKNLERNPEGTKPLNIIVITDGEPSDDVESPIINCARKLDKFDAPAWQVGIQFFQVGREPSARAHLKQLDDELAELSGQNELRDIVDTVPFTGVEGTELTGEGILKVVLGAVNRRLDRKKSDELHRKGLHR